MSSFLAAIVGIGVGVPLAVGIPVVAQWHHERTLSEIRHRGRDPAWIAAEQRRATAAFYRFVNTRAGRRQP